MWTLGRVPLRWLHGSSLINTALHHMHYPAEAKFDRSIVQTVRA